MADTINPPPDPPNQPQHNILITIPRTASNLLTHLLSLPSQTSIIPHPRDGYFFLPALSYRFKNSAFTWPYEAWNSKDREGMEEVLQTSVDTWRAWLKKSEREGKGTYVKEHINWTLSPSIESSLLHSSPPGASSEDLPLSSSSPPSPSTLSAVNPTAVPHAIWERVRVTFLIRHPALTFPSALRTSIDNEGLDVALTSESEMVQKWECTYRWHVLLYRFLVTFPHPSHSDSDSESHSHYHSNENENEKENKQHSNGARMGREPLIVDASQLQDVEFVRRYASLIGLDPAKVRTNWDATSEEEQEKLHKIERRMKDTLLDSTGVQTSKLESAGIDIATEKKKWEVEFGIVLAERLERLVRRSMGEYAWLYERRLRF